MRSGTKSIIQGRFLPVFAAEIVDQNPKLEASGLSPINLASLMIGEYPTSYINEVSSEN